jgi:hypothetical protein
LIPLKTSTCIDNRGIVATFLLRITNWQDATAAGSGTVLVVDVATGASLASVSDPAAAGTSEGAYDVGSGLYYLFQDGFILHPFNTRNNSFAAKQLVNLDQCVGAGDDVRLFFSSFLRGDSTRTQFFPPGKNGDLPSSPRGVGIPKKEAKIDLF